MNIKWLQINRWGTLGLLGAMLAAQSLRAEESIETLATFEGPNGAYPGYILQDKNGNFYGTTYTGGKYDKGTIFELPLNQPLVTLISFDGTNGANPLSGIVEGPDGSFYGTTHAGGPGGKGTVYRLTPQGKLDTLVSFNGTNGAYPKSALLLGEDGNFYGTTFAGGANDNGVLFSVTPQGKLTQLVTFSGLNGINPGSLSRGSDGSFYGTTYGGGTKGLGTAFKYDPDITYYNGVYGVSSPGAIPSLDTGVSNEGVFYGTIYNGSKYQKGPVYALTPQNGLPPLTHQDVAFVPQDASTQPITFDGPNGINPGALGRNSDNTDPGTTYGGEGKNGGVTAFKYGTNPKFISLVSFNGDNGAHPQAGLSQLSDGNFYGTTYGGGKNQLGTVFSLTPQGALSTVHSFDGTDGANPNSGLIQWSDGYFYLERIWENQWIKASTVQWSGVNFCGTTSAGGEHHNGTVFRITSDGSLTTLVSFTGTSGRQLGTIPNSIVPGNDGNLYGTTYYGGRVNKGTVFRLLLQLWPPYSDGQNATTFAPTQPVLSP
jgi:uncharacterized repeat protein (TIGR03803 family)